MDQKVLTPCSLSCRHVREICFRWILDGQAACHAVAL